MLRDQVFSSRRETWYDRWNTPEEENGKVNVVWFVMKEGVGSSAFFTCWPLNICFELGVLLQIFCTLKWRTIKIKSNKLLPCFPTATVQAGCGLRAVTPHIGWSRLFSQEHPLFRVAFSDEDHALCTSLCSRRTDACWESMSLYVNRSGQNLRFLLSASRAPGWRLEPDPWELPSTPAAEGSPTPRRLLKPAGRQWVRAVLNRLGEEGSTRP